MLKLALILPVAAGLSVGGVDPAANSAVSRRGAMSLLSGLSVAALGASAANAVPARTGLSSPFTGEYDDPAHPGCLRSVKVGGAPLGPDGRRKRTPVAAIRGTDGPNGGACTARPDTADVRDQKKTASPSSYAYALTLCKRSSTAPPPLLACVGVEALGNCR